MPTPVDRKSLTTSLEDRYKTQKAGGAFDAKIANTNNMIQGLQGSMGYSDLSKTLTIEPGFTINMANNKQENFKDKVLGDAKNPGAGLFRVTDTTKYKP